MILLTPGPTPLPPCVSEALSRPVLHHRMREFSKVLSCTVSGLGYVFRTKNTVLVQSGSGTSAMEACVANLMSERDNALVPTCGVFSERWVKILRAYGVKPRVIEDEWGNPTSCDKVLDELNGPWGCSYKAVFLTHLETSTGVTNPIRDISKIIRENSNALVVVDAVASAGVEPLETDGWGIDAVVSASQKGLMNAPGLSFVSLSERAWKAVETSSSSRFYCDFRVMRSFMKNSQTPYTTPTSLVAGQAAALGLIRAQGIENIWRKTARLAVLARSEIKRLGFEFFAKSPSSGLTAFCLPPDIDGEKLIFHLADKFDVHIASGQQGLKNKILRIAHMGYISEELLREGIAALEKAVPAKQGSPCRKARVLGSMRGKNPLRSNK